jgi:hypothetical protein
MFDRRIDRVLAALAAVGLIMLGIAEVIGRLDEPGRFGFGCPPCGVEQHSSSSAGSYRLRIATGQKSWLLLVVPSGPSPPCGRWLCPRC